MKPKHTFSNPVTLPVLLACMLTLFSGVFAAPVEVRMPFSPPEPIDEDAPFSFVAYGDIQGNYQKGHDGLVRQMEKEPSIKLLINAGDISPDNGKNYAKHFYPAIRTLAETTPFFPAPGNHDINWKDTENSRRGFRTFFSNVFDYLVENGRNPHLEGDNNFRTWYHYVYGNVLFILLDSNLFIDEGKYLKNHSEQPFSAYRNEQLKWIGDLLERYRRDSTIRAIFVAFHHSPFLSYEAPGFMGIGGHPGHSKMMVNLRLPSEGGKPGPYLLDLLREARVTAVFTGHEHYYERWVEEIGTSVDPSFTIHWVLVGQGGVKPRGKAEWKEEKISKRIAENDAYQSYMSRVRNLDPNWTSDLLHAYPTTKGQSSRFHSYVLVSLSSEEIRFETKDAEGEVRDSWTAQPRFSK